MRAALIFDCDGVLADTERDGHLPAFNRTFAEVGLPVRWSEAEYGEKLRIGGGKERMASLLTPELVAQAGLPEDAEAQRELLAAWHARKTAIYTEMVAAGRLPARPGVARVIGEALDAGWRLAVASTSAEASVRAVLEHVAGAERAARFDAVLAGDVVPRKKPAPDVYLLALERLGIGPDQALVIEDSRNGLEAARAAGLRCVVTVNGYTEDEDFAEAALVVSSLGDPGGERDARAREPQPRRAGRLGDPARPRGVPRGLDGRANVAKGEGMAQEGFDRIELVVRTMAQTSVDNERYFSELDAVVGDGDFGYSLARGFEIVIADWDGLDRADASTFLRKVALIITSRIGGTSGPLWGTAFLRAGMALKDADGIGAGETVGALRAAIEGIKQRGQSDVGDKTLLDALVPAVDTLEARLGAGDGPGEALSSAAEAARQAADATTGMLAKRGRAAYTGERSIGSPDAGAVGVAVMFERLSDAWPAA